MVSESTSSVDDIARKSLRELKRLNSDRFRLEPESLTHPLFEGTFLKERDIAIPYGVNGNLTSENTVVFAGQCLLKRNENSECPITLEDIIDTLKLRDFLERTGLPAVCMIPDSIYLDRKFLDPWFGRITDLGEIRRRVEDFTELYIKVRSRITPSVKNIRTSEIEKELNAASNRLSLSKLVPQIRQVYGGRFLGRKEEYHPLSPTILDYGLISMLLPQAAGYPGRNVLVFAEPDEICSVKAAETIIRERRSKLDYDESVGLIGQIPLPPLNFPPELKKNRMYGAPPIYRIHLNESDEEIRKKLMERPDFAVVTVYMSPVTDKDEFDYLRLYGEREDAVDILMGQIKEFRRYVEE